MILGGYGLIWVASESLGMSGFSWVKSAKVLTSMSQLTSHFTVLSLIWMTQCGIATHTSWKSVLGTNSTCVWLYIDNSWKNHWCSKTHSQKSIYMFQVLCERQLFWEKDCSTITWNHTSFQNLLCYFISSTPLHKENYFWSGWNYIFQV